MTHNFTVPKEILIVKSSSFGDIAQSLGVIEDLKKICPGAAIDWLVDAPYYDLVAPRVRRAIIAERKHPWRLREHSYDLLFDLQGNTKSMLYTAFIQAKVKVGYDLSCVREWPNVLATHKRFAVKERNIRRFYRGLIAAYFGVEVPKEEKRELEGVHKIMVCPGSKWPNKQLSITTWVEFLKEFAGKELFVVAGDNRAEAAAIVQEVGGTLVERSSIQEWQKLMQGMDLVLAVDSAALHLADFLGVPSFGIFGPTRREVFAPHLGAQGVCPYGEEFVKQCPKLRSCKTGACMKTISGQALFQAYLDQCGARLIQLPR